jgi:hypothetical protein
MPELINFLTVNGRPVTRQRSKCIFDSEGMPKGRIMLKTINRQPHKVVPNHRHYNIYPQNSIM